MGLVEPVNSYSQADRASKYGILFVLLTFVGFFMFELLKRLAIHPIQYLLVGLALAIFFLLLLSLSEHMAFWIAYLIASIACIGLLAVYLSAVLRSKCARRRLRGGADLVVRRAVWTAGVGRQRAGAGIADAVRDTRRDDAGHPSGRLVRAGHRRCRPGQPSKVTPGRSHSEAEARTEPMRLAAITSLG